MTTLAIDDDVFERFARYFLIGEASECWEWQGARQPRGYGLFRLDGRAQIASRVAAMLAGLDVRPGLLVCHRCDNPPCVNPSHLFVGTQDDNMADCKAKGRQFKKSRLGEKDWSVKFPATAVQEWKDAHAAGETFASIARQYGASRRTVSDAVQGKSRVALSEGVS